MSSNLYRLENFDIRFTDVGVDLHLRRFFRLLPPAGVILGSLQLVTGIILLLVSAALIAGAGVAMGTLMPVMVVALMAANVAVALDSGRLWAMAMAGLQLAVLAPAGYLLATAALTLPVLLAAHLVFVLLQLADRTSFRHAPVRVWLGAELGLLVMLALW